MALEKSSNI